MAANETWLEDMARQGYRLVGMTGWSGVFEKAEPFTCRYRMQPLSKKEIPHSTSYDVGLVSLVPQPAHCPQAVTVDLACMNVVFTRSIDMSDNAHSALLICLITSKHLL